ncbi:hypothetical protein D6089_09645 [Vibrio vulnificus]|nr:hypothetical protein [Vibrio vulnificus]EIY8041229.1 hypothetical protein [Vibrio vulnificus]
MSDQKHIADIQEIQSLFDALDYPKEAPVTLKVKHLIGIAKELKEKNEWNLVKNGLPKEDPKCRNTTHTVDIFGDGERWPNCYYCFLDEKWIDRDLGGEVSINVTHWKYISLPEVVEIGQ